MPTQPPTPHRNDGLHHHAHHNQPPHAVLAAPQPPRFAPHLHTAAPALVHGCR